MTSVHARLPGTLSALLPSLLLAAVMVLTISVAQEDDATRDPDFFAYLLGIAIAAALLCHRRWPFEVVLVTIGLLMVYYSLGYPAFSPAVALAGATFYAALDGRALRTGIAVAAFLSIGAFWQIVGEGTSAFTVIGANILADVALLAAVLMLGEAIHHRRAWAREVLLRQRRSEAERQHRAEAEAERARLHTAHELHDVLAHTVAGIGVQAAVAADYLDDDPSRARRAIDEIRAQTRRATGELGASIKALRAGVPGGTDDPVAGLDQLGALTDSIGRSGVEVTTAAEGDCARLPAPVDLTAYRIIQESLTNVVRHSGANEARVDLRRRTGKLEVLITDRGPALNTDRDGDSAGVGLVGMRERASAIGGTLTARATDAGGFRVEAALPIVEAER